MGKEAEIPDAWDDDWESQADKAEVEAEAKKLPEKEVKVTKAERLAKHAEKNKQLWESAYVFRAQLEDRLLKYGRETPETFHFLAARDNVPLKQEFKPALKVLSRKPTPKLTQQIDPLTGLARLIIDDEDDEEKPKKDQLTAEELRLKTQRDREEKQKRYNEARARILGTGSGSSTPVTTTPPIEEGRTSRGKGRSGRDTRQENRRADSQFGTKTEPKELFDPSYTPKPGVVTIQKRNGDQSRSGRSTPKAEDQISREPRGPDASGRGGFGFTIRGGKQS